MANRPWMPLYIADYLADTSHLGALQSGAYLHLIMHYWQHGGLPIDEAGLARIGRLSPAEWKRERPVLAAFFMPEWKHKRIDDELASATTKMEAKAAAGRSGGRAKWGEGKRAREHQETRSQRLAAARTLGTHTPLEWTALCEVLDGKCARCLGAPDKPVKDHITPIYQGGSDAIENLQPLCQSCNSAKGPEAIDHRQNVYVDWRERLAKRLADASQTPAQSPSQPLKEEISHPSGARPPDETKLAVEIYHDVAVRDHTGWPIVQRVTPQRRSAVLARLRECGGLEGWSAAMDRAGASAFLRGDNPKGWRADFDFFCQSKSFTKLMEGSYDDRKPTGASAGKQSPHSAFLGAIAREAEKRSGGGERETGADDGGGDFAGLPPPTPGIADDLEIPTFLRRQ